MSRCQTRMSCKHDGKGDLFKVVGMFIPNKASSPKDCVFCEWKCFQHKRLILLNVGAASISDQFRAGMGTLRYNPIISYWNFFCGNCKC